MEIIIIISRKADRCFSRSFPFTVKFISVFELFFYVVEMRFRPLEIMVESVFIYLFAFFIVFISELLVFSNFSIMYNCAYDFRHEMALQTENIVFS